MDGTLYLVTTPIGNLQDITLRALEVLKSVDVIAAEDTRHTRQLLTHFDIRTRLISYHAFNEHRKTDSLLDLVRGGQSVALVSDAGTPAIADPGFLLVRSAVEAGIEPVIVPGVSALTFAATAAGLPVDKLVFLGFAPVKSGRKQSFFEEIAGENRTVFFFESPHRITKTLDLMAEILGKNREIAVVREATKLHEEVLRGTIGVLLEANRNRMWKGEFVIAVSPLRSSRAEEIEEGK